MHGKRPCLPTRPWYTTIHFTRGYEKTLPDVSQANVSQQLQPEVTGIHSTFQATTSHCIASLSLPVREQLKNKFFTERLQNISVANHRRQA